MGAYQSTKGITNKIIGKDILAKSTQPDKNDTRWEHVGEVSNLYIYPVKSFSGNSVETAIVGKHGLQNEAIIDSQFLGNLHG